ncbi:sulfatase-like hydrolase/transferase [Aureliella helgolandensis]|uniref:Arylsulfatase n=1 Tax=Aureliella helgolandensis TaxID=2527968 RepID=A0A518G4J7_9BACT|nr:sulfatase-like hydrolase/transferase [Aureliella helgolandensis]QDV23521.1 Arylsulfatase [Aureliella helgolandensis]
MKTILLVCVSVASGLTAIAAEKPNILFIAIDDLRPELKCYGGTQVRTPHLDAFASQSMRFDRAYCQVPVCGASRASLMTGILPTAMRFMNYTTRADRDAPGAATLPETFKNAGYTTLSNGKVFHTRDDSEEESWSEPAWRPDADSMLSHDPATTQRLSESKQRGRIYESPDVEDNAYADGQVAEKSIQDLQRLKRAGTPFFLACGFVRPHMPFYAPKKYWDLYEREQVEIADNRYRPTKAPQELRGSEEFRSYHLADFDSDSRDFHRMMRHGYMASVSYVDELVGNVLAELERLELSDNTIVVVWGDHGWHLGEHNFWGKHNTMHLATRVPLIVRAPGKQAGRTAALVETSDIYPTLCSLAGIEIPETVQGRSFSSLLDAPQEAFRDGVYSRIRTGDSLITDRFTYTAYDGGASEMLYDLQADPSENENVAAQPEYAETVATMKRMLKQRQTEAAAAKLVAAPQAVPAQAASSPQAVPKQPPVQPQSTVEAPAYAREIPLPTYSEVKYGKHQRHVLDFWQADSETPTPLVMVIHGGGWNGGSKERLSRFADVPALLKAGISVAAINYRLMKHAQHVEPPVKAPLHDAARAVQFLRSQAGAWNIDKARIGASGGSAGACSSLWLAYHDDLSDPGSEDPIARESTRLWCVAVNSPQTTLDPKQMVTWTPNSRYGGHAFGKKNFAQFLAERESIAAWIAEYSPYALVSADDPPACLFFSNPPAMGQDQKDPTHTANFGIGLQRHCAEFDVECDVVYPGAAGVKYKTPTDFHIAILGQAEKP